MSDPGRIRVMVADDHSVFRMGLRELLEEAELEVVSEARTGEEAVAQAREHHPDVIVMDILMPGMSGIEAARQIKQELPNVGIVMVSALEDEEHILDAIQAGASGYLLKADEPRAVLQAVRNASEGKAFLPPNVAKTVLDRFAQGMTARQARGRRSNLQLTDRELTVLRLMAQGKRNREIANELCISERTVGNHLASIYSKLQIDDRVQAILYAIRKGIVKV